MCIGINQTSQSTCFLMWTLKELLLIELIPPYVMLGETWITNDDSNENYLTQQQKRLRG